MIRLFLAAGCAPLQNDVGGTWTPPSCTAGLNDVGATCKLDCNDDYELSGSSSVQCTENGWNSSNGNVLPTCQRKYGCLVQSWIPYDLVLKMTDSSLILAFFLD